MFQYPPDLVPACNHDRKGTGGLLCNANRLKFETRPRDTKDALDNVVLALATALRDSGAHDVPRFGGPHLYRTCSSSRTAEQFGGSWGAFCESPG